MSSAPGPHPLRRWGWAILIGALAVAGIVLSIIDTSDRVTPPLAGVMFGKPVHVQKLQAQTLQFDRTRISDRFVVEPLLGLGPLSPLEAFRAFLTNGAGLVLLALAALVLVPSRARTGVERLEGGFGVPIALGAGVVMVLLAAAGITLLRFTLLFLPVVPVVLLAALVAALFGIACISLAIGRLLHRRLHLPDVHPLVAAVAGALVVFDLAVIPYAGVLALAVVALAGLGLAVVTRFGSARGWSFGDLNF